MNRERIERLPEWAQRYINRLERDCKDYESQIAATSTGESAVTWSMMFGESIGIPERAVVNFRLGSKGEYIDCRLRDGLLKLLGSTTLVIIPSGGTNVIDVRVKQR